MKEINIEIGETVKLRVEGWSMTVFAVSAEHKFPEPEMTDEGYLGFRDPGRVVVEFRIVRQPEEIKLEESCDQSVTVTSQS